jgi:hypothetical protein
MALNRRIGIEIIKRLPIACLSQLAVFGVSEHEASTIIEKWIFECFYPSVIENAVIETGA